jgi:hypothetical protein
MRCRVVHALKHDGAVHLPGSVVDLHEDVVRLLPRGIVAVEDAPSPAASEPRVPLSASEKAQAVREAQRRIAKVTGEPLPPEIADDAPDSLPEPAELPADT